MKLDKVIKILGSDLQQELESASKEALEKRIINAEQGMQTVKEELENNQKYQELKENKKAMESGLKEVNKFQRAIIAYALTMLDK